MGEDGSGEGRWTGRIPELLVGMVALRPSRPRSGRRHAGAEGLARLAKRGGRFHFVSLAEFADEARAELEPRSNESPDRIHERRWATTFLAAVLERLR